MAGTCECGNEPSGSIKSGNFLTRRESVSFSRRTLLNGVWSISHLQAKVRESAQSLVGRFPTAYSVITFRFIAFCWDITEAVRSGAFN